MKFTIAISASLLVLASVVAATSVAQIKDDIKVMDASVDNLNNHLQIDTLNYFNGLAIKAASGELTSKIKTVSDDCKQLDGKPTSADAKEVIEALSKTQLKVQTATQRMTQLQKQFEKLGVAGLARSSISDFKTETAGLAEQLVAIAPAEQQTVAKNLAAKFNNNLAAVADAYQGETGKTQAEADADAAAAGAKQ